MDTKLIVSASPHLRSEETTTGLMANVIVALVPCVVASAIIFGLRALLVTAVSVVASVAFRVAVLQAAEEAQPRRRSVRCGHRHHPCPERPRGNAHRRAHRGRFRRHHRGQAAVRRHRHELCQPRSGGPYLPVHQLCRRDEHLGATRMQPWISSPALPR